MEARGRAMTTEGVGVLYKCAMRVRTVVRSFSNC